MLIKIISNEVFELGDSLKYQFSDKSLEELADKIENKPIYVGPHVVGTVIKAWKEDDGVYADVELSPVSVTCGFTLTSSEEQDGIKVIKTARPSQFQLTAKPSQDVTPIYFSLQNLPGLY